MSKKKRSLQKIKHDAHLFTSCRDLNDLQTRLRFSKNNIVVLGMNPKYYSFEIKKTNGGTRKIEAPTSNLLALQRKLNYYLQSVYYLEQPVSSYGYIISPKAKKSTKNIVKNAEQHLHCQYMLNVDFEDFFHQVKTQDVLNIFSNNPFSFNQKTALQLARICTYNNRLPMGAPTSPVLSNLYTIDLDNQLEQWAFTNKIKYTRFVDDLTFSSHSTKITKIHFEQIKIICEQYHLKLNPYKTKFLNPNDEKIVTGLLLSKTVDIHPDFYKNLNNDLKRLHSIYETSIILNHLDNNKLLKKFKQEVFGQINFIKTVEGNSSTIYKDYLNKYQNALNIAPEVFSKRWINFSYH